MWNYIIAVGLHVYALKSLTNSPILKYAAFTVSNGALLAPETSGSGLGTILDAVKMRMMLPLAFILMMTGSAESRGMEFIVLFVNLVPFLLPRAALGRIVAIATINSILTAYFKNALSGDAVTKGEWAGIDIQASQQPSMTSYDVRMMSWYFIVVCIQSFYSTILEWAEAYERRTGSRPEWDRHSHS